MQKNLNGDSWKQKWKFLNLQSPGQPRQHLRRSRSTSPAPSALTVNLASNFGAHGQPRQQLRRSPPPATSALPINLASNFGAQDQPRQQLRRSGSTSPATSALWVNLASNLGAPGQNRQQPWTVLVNLASNLGRSQSTSPATSGQPRQQLRRSLSTSPATSSPATSEQLPVNIASNLGAPGQPRQQPRRSRSTSPATSALPVNLASNLSAPGQPRQQPRQQLPVKLASNIGAPGQPHVKGVHLLPPTTFFSDNSAIPISLSPQFLSTRKKKCEVRSTFHIFCLLWFFFSPCPAQAQKKKKGQRDPHSHQLTEVNNPYLSLSLDIFCKAGPSICSRLRLHKKKGKVRLSHHIFCL